MPFLRLVFVFFVCLCLKASLVWGEESAPLAPQASEEYGGDAVSVLGVKRQHSEGALKLGVTPMAGGAIFPGAWRQNVRNAYTFGLAIEVPLTNSLAAELEGNYGDYRMSYLSPGGVYSHDFSVIGVGPSLKGYLWRGPFRPFLGAGVLATRFEGMTLGPFLPYRFSRWMGAAQVLAGAEVEVSRGLALGARASLAIPLLNRMTASDPLYLTPEAGSLNASILRLLGTVKVSL